VADSKDLLKQELLPESSLSAAAAAADPLVIA